VVSARVRGLSETSTTFIIHCPIPEPFRPLLDNPTPFARAQVSRPDNGFLIRLSPSACLV
jgi:hypothetical protein